VQLKWPSLESSDPQAQCGVKEMGEARKEVLRAPPEGGEPLLGAAPGKPQVSLGCRTLAQHIQAQRLQVPGLFPSHLHSRMLWMGFLLVSLLPSVGATQQIRHSSFLSMGYSHSGPQPAISLAGESLPSCPLGLGPFPDLSPSSSGRP
jgi:hypothetical protein